MMIKKLTLYLFLALSVAGIMGCTKWLDQKPQDGIVRDEFWQTKEQVDAAVTGIYASMLGGVERPLIEYFFIWGECRGDMVTPGSRADANEQDIVNLNMLPTNSYSNWSSVYQTINYCNTVIELAPGVLGKDQTFTQDHLNRAMAEALALRSLMYFYLVRTFRDIPLKLNATLSDDNITNIPQSQPGEVLDQIVSDLKKAKTGVPYTYGNFNTDRGRVTRFAVNAMLADVYLWMDKYAECVAECDTIINSSKFGLINAENFFNQVFHDGNSNEGIFELQFDVQKVNPFFNMHSAAFRRWTAAAHLPEEVYGVDVINTIPISDCRGDRTSFRSTDFTIWKYIGDDNLGNVVRTPDQSIANWIFYRYADILLLKAEAINQLDQPLEASRIVKTIRQRANAIDLEEMDSTSKSAMTRFILAERQRELAFEGKRWFDVLRNAKRNNYENRQLLLDMITISIAPERQQAAFNKLRDNNSHYFPIYFLEVQTNKLLVQNPFYK